MVVGSLGHGLAENPIRAWQGVKRHNTKASLTVPFLELDLSVVSLVWLVR